MFREVEHIVLSAHLYCTHCGAANQTGAATCFACGQVVQNSANASLLDAPSGPLLYDSCLKQRYRIIGQVGKGGFGAVYKGLDSLFHNRAVAIKEMNQVGLTPQEIATATEAFKHEAHLLAGLSHPNLPQIYDQFPEGGHWYLVMDFIEGKTLEDHLRTVKGGYLPVEAVLRIGIDLCTVLDYLHTCKPPIIFRDLKPDNIMVTPDGHLYLIDFGIARYFKPGQARDTIAFGSPGYAAPEQYGKAQTTARADIYSLGATLHHLLTGDDPAQTPFRFAPLQLRSQTTPVGLDTLIMQMLEIDERRRPASIASVKHDLQGFAAQMIARKIALPQAGVPFLYTAPAISHKTFIQSSPPLAGPVSLGITLYTYRSHTDAVRGLAWSPDSQRIASASNDHTVHIWDVVTGDHLFTYTGHTDAVRAVAWSLHGKQIASASNDHTVHVWDASTGDHLFTYTGHSKRVNALAWSPDSRCIASASDDKTVRVWDALTGNHTFTYRGHSDWVRAIAWSPDGKRLASAGDDQTVHVWNITPKPNILTIFTKGTYHGHSLWIRAVAWSPDSKRIASASDDQTVHIWDGAARNHMVIHQEHSPVLLLRAGGATLPINHVVIYQEHSDVVYSIGWSPTGKHLVSGSGNSNSYGADNTVRMWNSSTGDTLYTYRGHLDVVYAVAWSPDGSRIASGGKDNTVQVWQAL